MKNWLWLVLPALYFICRFLAAGLPQQHTDPLYYHLAAPKLWAEVGQIRLVAEHPSYAQAGLWEIVYGLPQIWFLWVGPWFLKTFGGVGFFSGDRQYHHVIETIFGQWMHALWGQGLTLLAAYGLMKKILVSYDTDEKISGFFPPQLILFLAWLITMLGSVEWLGCLAKNDFIMAAYGIAAMSAWVTASTGHGIDQETPEAQVSEPKPWAWLWFGLLLGFCYSVKTLGILWLLAAVPLVLWQMLTHKKSLQFLALPMVAGLVLAMSAFVGRQWQWTHNPLFPYQDPTWGPGWISDLWYGHLNASGGKLGFSYAMFVWLRDQLFTRYYTKLILFLGAGFSVYVFRKVQGGKKTLRNFLIAAGLQFVVMLVLLKPAADGRYGIFVGQQLMIGAVLAILISYYVRRQTVMTNGLKSLALMTWTLGLYINSPIDLLVKVPKNYLFHDALTYVNQFHWTHDSKRWLNENTKSDAKILVTFDKINFYLDRSFETIPEMKIWENRFENYRSAHDMFSDMSRLKYDYLHVSLEAMYPRWLKPYWEEILALAPKAEFRSSTSLVFHIPTMAGQP